MQKKMSKTVVAMAGLAVAMPAFGQFGGFGEVLSQTTGYRDYARDLAGGDITGDGVRDIVFLDASGAVAFYHGFTDGVFDDGATQIVEPDTDGRAIELFDYDGDGDLDLARLTGSNGGDLRVYANDGDGDFTFRFAIRGIGSFASYSGISMADFDGDGDDDLVIVTTSGLTVIRNIGGDFSRTPTYVELVNFTGTKLDAGDLDDDGRDDAVAISSSNDRVYILRSTGVGYEEIDRLAPGGGLVDVKLADIDADGDLDLAAVNRGAAPRRVSIYRNDGAGRFEFAYGLTVDYPREAEVVDIDGDGDTDVVVNSEPFSGSDSLVVFLNDGAGHFDRQADQWFYGTPEAQHIEMIDMDPATGPDLVTIYGFSTQVVTVRLNQTPFFAPTAPTLLTPANGATDLALPGQVSAWGGTVRPMVTWERAQGFGVTYSVVVSESASLSSPVFEVGGLTTRTADLSDANLRPGTTYYWSVFANNPRGGTGPVSGPFSFTTASAGEACRVDFDGDGELTIFDFLAFSTAFDAGCP